MAKELTPEQREAKRKRDAEYRARKKAEAQPLTNAALKEAFIAEADELDELEAEANDNRSIVLAAKLGEYVRTPRGGMLGYVQKTFKAGGRFVTEDGEGLYPEWCKHVEAGPVEHTVYFEQIGPGNKDWSDGAHGWAHRFSRCNKLVQVG